MARKFLSRGDLTNLSAAVLAADKEISYQDSVTHTIHGTGICTYIWLNFMVNVGKYAIHWILWLWVILLGIICFCFISHRFS